MVWGYGLEIQGHITERALVFHDPEEKEMWWSRRKAPKKGISVMLCAMKRSQHVSKCPLGTPQAFLVCKCDDRKTVGFKVLRQSVGEPRPGLSTLFTRDPETPPALQPFCGSHTDLGCRSRNLGRPPVLTHGAQTNQQLKSPGEGGEGERVSWGWRRETLTGEKPLGLPSEHSTQVWPRACPSWLSQTWFLSVLQTRSGFTTLGTLQAISCCELIYSVASVRA